MEGTPKVVPMDTEAYTEISGIDIAAIQNPRPLAIVGTHDGNLTGLATVIWVTPVSHEPNLMAVALRNRSYTLNLIETTRAFTVSFLEANQTSVEMAEFCGFKSGFNVNKAAEIPHSLISVEAPDIHAANLPVVQGCLSWEACKVVSIQRAGDHMLVIGEVIKAATRAKRDEEGRVCARDALLCIHHHDYAVACPIDAR